MPELTEQDHRLLQRAVSVSAEARSNGNMPFGAILADPTGKILLEAENTGVTEANTLFHAETNLMHMAVSSLSLEQIANATLYTSCEPCAMCSGAMYWGGINRMVYAMGEDDLLELTGLHPDNPTMTGVGCRTILNSGQRQIDVSGPHMINEASAVHEGYWTDPAFQYHLSEGQ